MKTTLALVLALATATTALANPILSTVPDDWSDCPRQRLHCPNKKCGERLRFLQAVFPPAP